MRRVIDGRGWRTKPQRGDLVCSPYGAGSIERSDLMTVGGWTVGKRYTERRVTACLDRGKFLRRRESNQEGRCRIWSGWRSGRVVIDADAMRGSTEHSRVG